ncbi:hypothetical protein IWQ61_000775 [Dispira simplex]|nr:hypothetical protein IWQ61_000775 [Dispira simplex]
MRLSSESHNRVATLATLLLLTWFSESLASNSTILQDSKQLSPAQKNCFAQSSCDTAIAVCTQECLNIPTTYIHHAKYCWQKCMDSTDDTNVTDVCVDACLIELVAGTINEVLNNVAVKNGGRSSLSQPRFAMSLIMGTVLIWTWAGF